MMGDEIDKLKNENEKLKSIIRDLSYATIYAIDLCKERKRYEHSKF